MSNGGVRDRRTILNAVALAVALPWSLFLMFSHQPWFDEIQSWEIALNSATPVDLFWNLKHEGHPILWYGLLWGASFVNDTLITPKIIHAILTCFIFWLIAVQSPFSILEKILLYTNVYILCEYGIISRSYCLSVALTFLYAWLLVAHRERIVLRMMVLSGLANVSAFSALLSLVLLVHEILYDRIHRTAAHAIGLYLVFLSFAGLTMMPAGDIVAIGSDDALPRRLITEINSFIAFPFIPRVSPEISPDSWQYLIVAALFGVAWSRAFGPSQRHTFIWAGSALLFIAFGTFVYPGRVWHTGLMLSVMVLCLWLAVARGTPHARPVVALLLAPGAVIGLGFSVSLAGKPFSHAADVADWIRSHGRQDELIVGAPGGETAVTIGAMLGQPIFDPGCRCRPKFALWSRDNQIETSAVAPAIAWEMRRRHTARALLILPLVTNDRPEWLSDAGPLSAQTLVRFTNAFRPDGDYAIVQLTTPSSSSIPPILP